MNFRKREIVGDYNILILVNEIETLIRDNRHKNGSLEDLKRDFSDAIDKLEEKLNGYLSENDLKIWEPPDNFI